MTGTRLAAGVLVGSSGVGDGVTLGNDVVMRGKGVSSGCGRKEHPAKHENITITILSLCFECRMLIVFSISLITCHGQGEPAGYIGTYPLVPCSTR